MESYKLISIDPGINMLGYSVSEYNIKTGILNVTETNIVRPSLLAKIRRHELRQYETSTIALDEIEKWITDIVLRVQPDYVASEAAFFNPGRPAAYASLLTCIRTMKRALFQLYMDTFTFNDIYDKDGNLLLAKDRINVDVKFLDGSPILNTLDISQPVILAKKPTSKKISNVVISDEAIAKGLYDEEGNLLKPRIKRSASILHTYAPKLVKSVFSKKGTSAKDDMANALLKHKDIVISDPNYKNIDEEYKEHLIDSIAVGYVHIKNEKL